MNSVSEFTLRDPVVKGLLVLFGMLSLLVILGVNLIPGTVTFWVGCLLIFALFFALIESRRLYKRYVWECWRIQDLKSEIKAANGPRLTKFLIDDPKLKLSTTDTKRILIGLYQVEVSGQPIAAEEGMLELELWDWSPDSHNNIARAPFYGKPERDPRTGRYVMKIFDTYYTLPKCYKS